MEAQEAGSPLGLHSPPAVDRTLNVVGFSATWWELPTVKVRRHLVAHSMVSWAMHESCGPTDEQLGKLFTYLDARGNQVMPRRRGVLVGDSDADVVAIFVDRTGLEICTEPLSE